MEDLAIGVMRTLLWAVNNAVLYPMDALYNIVLAIARLDVWEDLKDLHGNSIMEQLWKIAMMGLVAAIIIRVLAQVLGGIKEVKKIVEDDLAKKLVIIVLTTFLVGFLPYAMRSVGHAASYINGRVGLVFGIDAIDAPSTIILTACDDASISYWIDNDGVSTAVVNNKKVKLSDITDINEKDGGVYTHFSKLHLFFISLFVSIYACIQLVAVALDTSKRWFEIIVIVFFSFIPISSLIDEGEGFKEWAKCLFFAYASNYAELFILLMSMAVCLSLKNAGSIIQIIMLIGGFLFAQQGSNFLARFMGIDSSGSTLQQLSQISMIAGGVGSGVTGVARGIYGAGKSAVSTGGNMTVLSVGKALGGVGASNYGKIQTSISTSGDYSSNNQLAEAEQAARRANNTSFLNSIGGTRKTPPAGGYGQGMAGGTAGPGETRAYRSDTYSQNQVWKDSSPIRQLLDYGIYNTGTRARAAYFAGQTISDIYEHSLKRRSARRYR